MIRLVEGSPGSGKSYYAVSLLIKLTGYDLKTRVGNSNVRVISNIDNLKIDHENFDEFYKSTGLRYEAVRGELLRDGRHCVMVIDECQRYLAGCRENDVFFTFEYHRHLGVDIILVCQTRSAIPKRIVELCEFIVCAKSASIKKFNRVFEYEIIDSFSDKLLDRVSLRVDERVFGLYKSFEKDEFVKPKSYVQRRYIFGLLICVLGLGLATCGMNKGMFFGAKQVEADREKRRPAKAEVESKKSLVNERIDESVNGVKRECTSCEKDNKVAYAILRGVECEKVPLAGGVKGKMWSEDGRCVLFYE